MTLKKPASSKRAPLLRRADHTKAFAKDWERLSRSGRYDLHRLKEVMLLIVANDGPLPAQWRDHALRGEWADHRECHVGGDFLLIYQCDSSMVVFVRAGTHTELFEE